MREEIIEYSILLYEKFLPVATLGLVVLIVILLPLAVFRKTRSFAGKGVVFFSFVIGVTTWLLGTAITFIAWGWPAVIIGILLGGVGVVPIAILASFIKIGAWEIGASLIVMSILVYASRWGGIILQSDQYED